MNGKFKTRNKNGNGVKKKLEKNTDQKDGRCARTMRSKKSVVK